jgi:hypothetical protein
MKTRCTLLTEIRAGVTKGSFNGLGVYTADSPSTLAAHLAQFACTRQALLASLLSEDIQ